MYVVEFTYELKDYNQDAESLIHEVGVCLSLILRENGCREKSVHLKSSSLIHAI